MTERVRPWQVKPGDRVLGTPFVVTGHKYAGQHDLGGDVERQRYDVEYHNTDTDTSGAITYGGDSWLTVIR